MNDFLLHWALLAAVNIAATLSPGPAFAMTIRTAVAQGRSAGIMNSIGLGIGVGAHVLFLVFGLSLLISKSEMLYDAIKYAGAAYLMFVGVKSIMAKPANTDSTRSKKEKSVKQKTALQNVWNGFLTNILNPKAFVFFTAVYSQFIMPGMPFFVLVVYGMTGVIIEILWFSGVTIFLTAPKIRAAFTKIAHWIERLSGGLLMALGVKLALSRI